MIHEITDLQISNINIEKRLNDEIISLRSEKQKNLEFALLQRQLTEMGLRLNKRPIRIVEKLSFLFNKLIGRNQ